MAQAAALNSHLLRNSSPPLIEQSILLAIEALQRQNNPDTRFALQETLSVLPQLKMEMTTSHPDASQLLWSDDGRFLISRGSGLRGESSYQLWDVATGELLEQLPVTVYDGIYDWSDDGRYLILRGWPDETFVFDTVTNRSILSRPDTTFGLAAAFSPDNNLIAYSTDIKVEPNNEESREYAYILVIYDLSASEEIMFKLIEPARERTVASYDAMAFSGDGRYVAGASLLRMDIWDLVTQQIVAQFPLEIDWPEAALFSPDNTYVAVSGFDGTQVWNLAEGFELPLGNPFSGDLQTLRFSADGKYLVAAREERWDAGEGGSWYQGQNGTQVWEMSTGEEVLRLPEVNAGASFIGDTHNLLTINQDDAIQIWNIDARKMLVQSQLNAQRGIAIHPTGDYVAGVDENGTIRIWSPEPFLTTQTISPMTITENYRSPDNLTLVTYSPDGSILATASWEGIVRLWATQTGQEQISITKTRVIRDLVFNPDGTSMIIGGGNYLSPAPDWQAAGFTFIQEIATGQSITLTHDIHVRDVAFAPNGRTFATASNMTQLWDADNGDEIWACAPDIEPLKLLFSPTGDKLIVLAERTIVVCDVGNGQTLKQIQPQGNSQFQQMVLHPDGRLLAVSEPNAVNVWNLETEMIVASFPVDRGKLMFSPNGRYLGTMPLRPSASNSLLTIWETETWQPVLESPERLLNDFAFSPDSHYLALANDKGAAWVLSLPDGREINRLQEHIPTVQVAFNPDGKQIALLGEWEKVLLWRWNPDDWINEACGRLSRNLTQTEWTTYFPGEQHHATCARLPFQNE